MKRKLIKYSIMVFSLLMLYLGYIAYQGPSVKGELTEKDLPPVSFEPDNGFYILRALLEPPEVEVPSPGVIAKYREIYDLDKVQKIRKHIRKATEKEKKDLQKIEPYWKLLNQIFKVYNFAENYRQKKDILTYYLSRKKDVKKIEEGCSFFLKRYYRLINSEKVEDFTYDYRYRYYPPPYGRRILIPIRRLFHSVNLIDAAQGKWESALRNFLKEISFFHKFMKTARIYKTFLLSRRAVSEAYKLLPILLNHQSCPKRVYSQVLTELQAIPNRTVTPRNTLISSYILNSTIVNQQEYWKIYIPKNRIKQYYLNCYRQLLKLGVQKPFQRPEKISNTIQQMEDNNTIPFNVWGDIEDLGIVIDYPFQIRALNDLVCICAELHLKYDPNKTIKENLENLDSYKSIDPFSGEPYRYNSKKQILYSIGKNRKDDNGTPYSIKAWREPYDDIVIPCVINVKNRQKVQGARK